MEPDFSAQLVKEHKPGLLYVKAAEERDCVYFFYDQIGPVFKMLFYVPVCVPIHSYAVTAADDTVTVYSCFWSAACKLAGEHY